MKVLLYVDGLNFYESSKRQWWYPYGWCNWRKTIENYCPGSEVQVKYFTSERAGKDPEAVGRQRLHLKAMEEVAGAKIIKGETRRRIVKCQRCGGAMRCPECGSDEKFTEKMTDVKIALHILEDAIDDAFDRAYLVSGDLDLLPALEAALRRNDRAQIIVLFPPDGIIVDEFKELEKKYEKRVRCAPLDTRLMQRFPDDLPKRWRMELPEHWRADAGPRPGIVRESRAGQIPTNRRPKGKG